MKTVREIIACKAFDLDFPDGPGCAEPPEPALKWADSILSALKEAGWVCVPVEPTEKMCLAVLTDDPHWTADMLKTLNRANKKTYQIMIAASQDQGRE